MVFNREKKSLENVLKEEKMRLYNFFVEWGRIDSIYLEAFLRVPREEFVLPEYRRYAYRDTPLPLIKGATISAISMSLLLCQYAELKPGKTVFEVGTGSGYNAALCAEVVTGGNIKEYNTEKPVCTMEIDPDVFEFGYNNLKRLSYLRVIDARLGDGTLGWPETRQFDAIIVTAAGRVVPKPLKYQLKIGGVLVMPLEIDRYWQVLIKIRRIGKDEFIKTELDAVRFVPLRGKYGV